MSSPPKRTTRSQSTDNDMLSLLSKMEGRLLQASSTTQQGLKTVLEKLSSLESRIDNIENCLGRLTSSQAVHEKKIADLSNEVGEMKSCITNEVYDEVHQRVKRSKNVIISGVQEHLVGSVDERRVKDTAFVLQLLQAVKVECGEDDINVARLGKIQDNSYRLLRVTFPNDETATQALQAGKELRHHDEYKTIFINIDRTKTQQQQFSVLRRELKARREKGEDAVIFRNKVVSRESLRTLSQKDFH